MNICKNNALQNFPYLEDDFDSLTDYELFSKMSRKVDELYNMLKGGITEEIKNYIDTNFNNMMLNSLYDAEEEKLVLYMEEEL